MDYKKKKVAPCQMQQPASTIMQRFLSILLFIIHFIGGGRFYCKSTAQKLISTVLSIKMDQNKATRCWEKKKGYKVGKLSLGETGEKRKLLTNIYRLFCTRHINAFCSYLQERSTLASLDSWVNTWKSPRCDTVQTENVILLFGWYNSGR